MPIVHAAVKALVTNGDQFLLLQQEVGDGYCWDLPGGRIQFGETPEAALQREAKEELGQPLVIGRPLGAWWFFRRADGDQVVCLTYLCTIENPELTLPAQDGETIAGYKWVARADLAHAAFDSLPPSLRDLIVSL